MVMYLIGCRMKKELLIMMLIIQIIKNYLLKRKKTKLQNKISFLKKKHTSLSNEVRQLRRVLTYMLPPDNNSEETYKTLWKELNEKNLKLSKEKKVISFEIAGLSHELEYA